MIKPLQTAIPGQKELSPAARRFAEFAREQFT